MRALKCFLGLHDWAPWDAWHWPGNKHYYSIKCKHCGRIKPCNRIAYKIAELRSNERL